MKEIAVLDQNVIDNALGRIESIQDVLDSPTDSNNAQAKKDISLELSKLAKSLDIKRQDAVKPALEEQRRVNSFFKPAIDLLEQTSKKLIQQVNEFVRIEEKKERERIAEEARIASEKLLQGQKPEPIRPVSPNVVTTTTTKVWVYEVVDQLAIPRQFLEPSDKKIMDSIKAGVRSIPGIKIYQEERVVRR
jgi:DNA mismatch repair ATPase MutS